MYGLLVDLDRCVGCHACEIACKHEHNLPTGVRWIKVVQIGPKKINGKLSMIFIPSISDGCTLCQDRINSGLEPFCVATCPTKALKFCDIAGILEKLGTGKPYQLCKLKVTK